ncbi:hypothetical protein [Sphingomonas melonis]|uniref:hypothetical protein n=1 Tax=Sphingomonas melonis TaxID=152682 RepID=UPI0015C86BEE|nr:hypothetical protein [Sphingomonas melonis]
MTIDDGADGEPTRLVGQRPTGGGAVVAARILDVPGRPPGAGRTTSEGMEKTMVRRWV